MEYYCMAINAVGNALTWVGNGAHFIYARCGEGLYWVATLGKACN